MSALNAQLSRLTQLRADQASHRDALVRRAEADGRDELDERETRQFRQFTTAIDSLDQRIADLHDEIKRSGRGDRDADAVRKATANATGAAPTLGHIAPIAFDVDELRRAHQALSQRQSYRLEQRAFSTVDPLLPPYLSPTIVGPQHENRLLSRLPIAPTESPFVEFIRHYSTTGAAAMVAEGQPKPELTFNTDKILLPMLKLAAHIGTSWESLQDFDSWQQYTTGELARQIYDVENAQLLLGPGTGGNLTGFTSVSGILTHVAGQGTTPITPLDDIELAIAQMRTGAALAEPRIAVFHPSTWSAIRRQKDQLGRYLTSPDPTADEANSVWGVPVLTTTQFTAGDGLLVDTARFGRVYWRDGLSLLMGYSGDDFTSNIIRFVGEERFNLAVERPAAVLHITGLPVA